MKVRDVMTSDVVSVGPEASIDEAVQLMLQRRISGLPVIDHTGELVGVVTEGDFLRRAETGTQRQRSRWIEFFTGPGKLASEYVQTSGRKVHQVMTTDVQTATEDTALEEIVRLMERRRIKRVPILRGQKLVGIVSRANLLRALANVAREVPPPRPEDAIIRERLLAELKKQNWAPVGTIDAIVRGGVVTLSGLLTDERQREALLVATQNIPGVVKVEDDMVWMDPVSGTFLQPPKIS
jgi:CBS domain-containing protein